MTKKKVFVAALIVFIGALAGWSRPAVQGPSALEGKPGSAWGMMKLRVFEGLKEGTLEPVKVVTTSFLNYTVTASIQSEADAAAQEAKLKQIFNLKGVSLLTEADLVWDKGRSEKAFHFFRLGDKDYLVLVTPVDIPKLRFRIEVFEQKNGAKTNLLDTEFTVAPKNAAVFGFNAVDGKPYFISMQTIKWPSEIDAQIILGSDAVPEEGPVRAVGSIKPPKLIKMVDPVYPEVARKARVEGVVILEAQTDQFGRVQNIKILRSIPLLDQAAIESVRQWVYEPMMIEGKPRGIIFTVTVRFSLDDQPRAFAMILPKEGEKEFRVRIGNIPIVYPKEAIANKLKGSLILEAIVDEKGRVSSVRVIEGVAPILDKAAIDAVRGYSFQPISEGAKIKPGPVTVTVSFALPGDRSGAKGVVSGVGIPNKEGKPFIISIEDAEKLSKMEPIKAEGKIQPPQLIKQVDPVYPEDARAAGVEGIVILEAQTDFYGRVESIKVLRPIPALDKAAIDAVRQWIYEPLIIDGKPRRCIFTVTVRFTLK